MCIAIYIAANTELPIVESDSSFHTRSLVSKADGMVRKQFSGNHVVYAGSYEGCGCGFHKADLDELFPEEAAQARASLTRLAEYLSKALATGAAVELFSCWEGEQGNPPVRRGTLSPAQIAGGVLESNAPELYAIRTAG